MNRYCFDEDIDYEWSVEKEINMATKVIVIEACSDCPHHTKRTAAFDCFKTQRINPNYPIIPTFCPLESLSEVTNG